MSGTAGGLDGKHVSLLWAGPDRAADIARLHVRLFEPSWDEGSIRRLLDHPASTAFVATLEKPDHVVGFVLGQIAADESEILSIGVDPGCQRSGLGERLVSSLMRAVARAEVRRIYLEVASDNDAALRLYAKSGFERTGRRAGYYARPGGPPADAVTMARTLT